MIRFVCASALGAGLLLTGIGSAAAAHDKHHACCHNKHASCADSKTHTCSLGVMCCESGNRAFFTKSKCKTCGVPGSKKECCCSHHAKK